MLALGIWAFNVEETCMHEVIMESINVPIIIIIVAGAVIMLTAFLGCYSTCNETKKGIVSVCAFHNFIKFKLLTIFLNKFDHFKVHHTQNSFHYFTIL